MKPSLKCGVFQGWDGWNQVKPRGTLGKMVTNKLQWTRVSISRWCSHQNLHGKMGMFNCHVWLPDGTVTCVKRFASPHLVSANPIAFPERVFCWSNLV
jgi:hypothetical protein